MCFSATASFGSAAILLVAGTFTLKSTENKSQIWLAAIPIFFSLQQCVEGLVWLSLTHPAFRHFEQISVFSFLFFAQVLWPIWVPLSVFQLEMDSIRKKWLLILLVLGSILAIFMSLAMLKYPIHAEIISFHIDYNQDFPLVFKNISGIVYFLVTVTPAFISGRKPLIIFGSGILMTYLITQWLYPAFIISVWCFFAAIHSMIILMILKQLHKKTGKVVAFSQAYLRK